MLREARNKGRGEGKERGSQDEDERRRRLKGEMRDGGRREK
jgi:hypothetical protein